MKTAMQGSKDTFEHYLNELKMSIKGFYKVGSDSSIRQFTNDWYEDTSNQIQLASFREVSSRCDPRMMRIALALHEQNHCRSDIKLSVLINANSQSIGLIIKLGEINLGEYNELDRLIYKHQVPVNEVSGEKLNQLIADYDKLLDFRFSLYRDLIEIYPHLKDIAR